ncbi:hypothetical protein GOBAR_DD28548 [Gossypium barbadense]|nr:hypothetical protein GOBAR_DD28548 [Gossypium barbadense]
MMANKKATFCGFMLMWLLARKLFGKQTIERYRLHTKDNETNKPIEQNLQYLKAESANMLKTVEDLEVSRRNVCAKIDYCKYENQLLTLFKSLLYFAGLVSTFGASYVTRNKGRRASILIGVVSFFLGGASNAGVVNITMLIIGRILLGADI